ncbi:NADH-quinone oxidoreductase [Platysternon megacephalum]|uniref:NADH-quinone oxidoreductase n=1 Tax=Platysternon megacephalum TaxID=55544 RepID=A0A4D9DJQ5_9SAUR|nr:NADH-quinone oxidoreductase [Platysternon megacephalum]
MANPSAESNADSPRVPDERGRRKARDAQPSSHGVRRNLKPGDEVLRVTGLHVEFGVDKAWVPAAIDLNYEVRAGEVLALVGESGSGKSVSSMSLLGLLPKNARVSGSVMLNGREVLGASDSVVRSIRGREVAVIFQEPMTAMNPVYTIGQQIIETVRLHNPVSPAQAAERALEMLKLVELPDPERAFMSYPHQLSGGQRQRAMIAQSLSCDPELLIADEPTTALDVTVQAEILDLIRNLRTKLNSAIILITHDMGVVADLSDRIAVMRHGRIVETGDARQIFSNPRHPYTQELLAAVPHLGHGSADAAEVDLTVALAQATNKEDLVPMSGAEIRAKEAENAAELSRAQIKARRAAEEASSRSLKTSHDTGPGGKWGKPHHQRW